MNMQFWVSFAHQALTTVGRVACNNALERRAHPIKIVG